MKQRYDVFAIGHAIVDTEVRVEDAVVERYGLARGVMTLVSAESQAALLAGLDGRPQHHAAGGSAANTLVGLTQLGGSACFAGKVGADEQGGVFRASLANVGVDFATGATADDATGSCLILVTPDGERTMQTHLGASAQLGNGDIDPDRVAASSIAYVEGYLFGSPSGLEAAQRVMAAASDAGATVALTLSDPAMTTHFLHEFKPAASRYADVLFCNEHEAEIYAGGGSREERLEAVAQDAPLVFMTCGADGAMVWDRGTIARIPGHVVPVVDTTGAGDAFAAGALYGLTRGMSAADAARIGAFISARIVSLMGPRLPGPPGAGVEAMLAGAHPLG